MTRSFQDAEAKPGTWQAALRTMVETVDVRPAGHATWHADDEVAEFGPVITREDVAFHAREVFASHGCVPGQDELNWLEAENTLRSEDDLSLHA